MVGPTNLSEWVDYIQNLSGQRLFSQVVAANSQQFSRTLVDEGATMGDVEQVMLLFVRQLRATGTKVPAHGPWDLLTMALTDPIARKGPTMSEEEADLLESFHKTVPDELDDFELEASFED